MKFNHLTGDLPARRAAWQDDALARDPHIRAFRTQLERVVSTPKVPEWELIATRLQERAESAVRGAAIPESALASLDRDVDRILEKRRWLIERERRKLRPGGRPVRNSIEKRETRAAWLFLAPALILFGVFFLVPVLVGLFLSFTDFDIYAIAAPATARFVGLRNYFQVLSNPVFWTALKNTLYFVVVGGPLSVVVSLGAALLVNARLVRYKAVFRTIFFAPVVTTLVAVAIVWRYLYHPHYGLLNQALGVVGIGPIDWLGDPHWAMPAIILLAVWKNFGYNMLIFVAGLQSIPE